MGMNLGTHFNCTTRKVFPMDSHIHLSRREREIMDIVYARGQASATDVLGDMPDLLTRASVRTMLRILEEKGHLRHKKKGREFIYQPMKARKQAGQSAMRRVLKTFFDGSLEKAVAAHMADPGAQLSASELKRLGELIRQVQKKGK